MPDLAHQTNVIAVAQQRLLDRGADPDGDETQDLDLVWMTYALADHGKGCSADGDCLAYQRARKIVAGEV